MKIIKNKVTDTIIDKGKVQHYVNRLAPYSIIETAIQFETTYPFFIHVDSGRNINITPDKGIIIPLSENTRTIFFKQRWYGLSANFFRGKTEFTSSGLNDNITDYSNIVGLDFIDQRDLRDKYFPHITDEMMWGLTVDRIVEWEIGQPIVFDRFQLHCGGTFIDTKKAITIFTNKGC